MTSESEREQLEQAYAAAWEEWIASGDAEAWDQAVGDGISGDEEVCETPPG